MIYGTGREKLGIQNMEVTGDMKFSLEEVECMGHAVLPQWFAINEDYYENLSKEKVDEILNS